MSDDGEPHLTSILELIADELGDADALVQGSRSVSWQDFDDRAARLAAVFSAAVGADATVAIDLYNCPEYFEVFHAALKAGLVPANVNYRYVDEELVSLLRTADAAILVFHASLADLIERVRPQLDQIALLVQVDGDDDRPPSSGVLGYEEAIRTTPPLPRSERSGGYYLSFTGGTTGQPKGVRFNIGRATANGFGLRDTFLEREPEDGEDPVMVARLLRSEGEAPVTVPASPLMHSTAFIFASLPTLQAGGTIVMLESRSFDADELWRVVARCEATILAIVGDAFARPALRALEDAAREGQPYDTSSLRVICSAGVAWSADVKAGLLAHAPQLTLLDACGSTEGATYGFRIVKEGSPLSTTNFDPLPGVMVLDANGEKLPPGEVGLLASPTPCDGYYGDPDATRRAFCLMDGLQYTIPGDYGRIEPDGTLTLIGRGTSVINSGGEKIHPEEVERVINEVTGVDDSIVFGVPDDRLGATVAAVVSTRPDSGVTAQDITDNVRGHLAGYKLPRRIELVAEVPRMPNGKPDFEAARRLLGA